MKSDKFLSRGEAKAFYDRLGLGQDWQSFYEGEAIRDLRDHGDFAAAHSVLELGCGTGAFALDLLQHHLPTTAWYLGLDVSSTMVKLSRQRLARFGPRAQVWLTDGSLAFPLQNAAVDRFVANYVLDLLPPDDIAQVLAEAQRLLKPTGRLCLVSLTAGRSVPGQVITWAWTRAHRLNPSLVGGCRPLHLLPFLAGEQWCVGYHHLSEAYGMASEVVIASKR
ncbi:MAG: class I SAM-dependent methyltransferase [Caldilineaceae bacterium]